MKPQYFFYLITLLALSSAGYGQQDADTLQNKSLLYDLKNDTLFDHHGGKIFVGQTLTLGNDATGNGKYRSIISKWAAIVPTIWGPDSRYENEIENHVDNKKGKASLLELKPGVSLTVKKIVLTGNRKYTRYYMVLLSTATNEYRADIALALRLRELLMQ